MSENNQPANKQANGNKGADTQEKSPKKPTHEVIHPPNKLKEKVRQLSTKPGQKPVDPVKRAELELKKLEPQFSRWMEDEVQKLVKAWAALNIADGSASLKDVEPEKLEALFRIAHDIRGQASTLGHPHVTKTASSLADVLDSEAARERVPSALVHQYIKAIQAIVIAQSVGKAEQVADTLSVELQAAIKNFVDLIAEQEKALAAKLAEDQN